MLRRLLVLLLLSSPAWAQTVTLPDEWRLAPDDRPEYREVNYDDHAWKLIRLPAQLQQEGFQLPDGVIWFRAGFEAPEALVGKPMQLVLGKVDAADDTYLNGQRVGGMGTFPPNPKTAWCETRFYPVVLRRHNLLAIRVYHSGTLGGITDGPLGVYDADDFQREFHPPPGARASFGRLVSSNGQTVGVYDFDHDMVPYVLPHLYQSYRAGQQVQAILRHLQPVDRGRPLSVAYQERSHVIEVAYPDATVRYFAPFSRPDMFCALVSGPHQADWRFRWDGQCPNTRVGLPEGVCFGFGSNQAATPAILERELAFMREVHSHCHFPAGLERGRREVLEQSVSVLKMAQVGPGEPSAGQIVASLPPGAYNVAWVRDGYYATMALIRLGLYDEARKMLNFELTAPSGHYQHLTDRSGKEVGVGVPYRISVCRYFGNGEEESFSAGDSGPNLELDGFGLFLSAYAAYLKASGEADFAHDLVEREVVSPILHNLGANGLIRAESGPWERYLDFKQFTYTSVACARGLADYGHAREADSLKAAILRLLVMPGGWLKGNVEAVRPEEYDSHDGGTFEAFSLGVLDDPALFSTQFAEYSRVLGLPGSGRGFARINQGDSYETAEWVLLDLRVASALARFGRAREAEALLDWVTSQARVNHDLIPELYRRDNWAYDGSLPMVGFGAGAYTLAVYDLAR